MIRGSVNFRQTEVVEAVAGSTARLAIQSLSAMKSSNGLRIGLGPRNQAA